MRSYDYCHFEICLGSDDNLTLAQVDDMRKDAQRLVDKAVDQYKLAKKYYESIEPLQYKQNELEKKVLIIKENYPASEWTPEHKATIKALKDIKYKLSNPYDYYDDEEDEDYDDEEDEDGTQSYNDRDHDE